MGLRADKNDKKTEDESIYESPVIAIPLATDAGKENVKHQIRIPEDENNKLPSSDWALDEIAEMLSDLNADSSDEEENTSTPLPSLIEKILG